MSYIICTHYKREINISHLDTVCFYRQTDACVTTKCVTTMIIIVTEMDYMITHHSTINLPVTILANMAKVFSQ